MQKPLSNYRIPRSTQSFPARRGLLLLPPPRAQRVAGGAEVQQALPLLSRHTVILSSIMCAPTFDGQTRLGTVAKPTCENNSEGGTGRPQDFYWENHFSPIVSSDTCELTFLRAHTKMKLQLDGFTQKIRLSRKIKTGQAITCRDNLFQQRCDGCKTSTNPLKPDLKRAELVRLYSACEMWTVSKGSARGDKEKSNFCVSHL